MGEVVTLDGGYGRLGKQAEELIDLVEAGGMNVYVMQGEIGPFLAFEHGRPSPDMEALEKALAATRLLTIVFRESAALRQRMADAALSEGSLYRAA